MNLPDEVEATLRRFWTCELSTLSLSGTPITWPVYPMYLKSRGEILTFSSIGLPQKALNARKNPAVSLLYSDATGSGLEDPLNVFIQGLARVPAKIFTSPRGQDEEVVEELRKQMVRLVQAQPEIRSYLRSRWLRRLMDWYFMRLAIFIQPVRVYWWPCDQPFREARSLEVERVAAD